MANSKLPQSPNMGASGQGSNTSEVEQMTCCVIKHPKNCSYWSAVMLLLYTILITPQIPGYMAAGFLSSFLVAGENEPVAALKRTAKARSFSIKIIEFVINHGTLALNGQDPEAALIFDAYVDNVDQAATSRGVTYHDFDPADLSSNACSVSSHAGVIRQILFISAKSMTNPNEASQTYSGRSLCLASLAHLMGLGLWPMTSPTALTKPLAPPTISGLGSYRSSWTLRVQASVVARSQ